MRSTSSFRYSPHKSASPASSGVAPALSTAVSVASSPPPLHDTLSAASGCSSARGAQLKAIGTAARLAMERLFGRKVFLTLRVRVRENWADDEAAVKRFGYGE